MEANSGESRRIEEAALNAWPAIQTVLLDGWVVRMAQGYTKRANSVTPLYPESRDFSDKVLNCESLFRGRGQVPIFRILSFNEPEGLDGLLASRGYTVVEPSLVMRADLSKVHSPMSNSDGQIQTHPLYEWINLHGRLRHLSQAQVDAHRDIVERIAGKRRLVALVDHAEVSACGMAVLEAEYVGVFDMIVEESCRRRGFGTALIADLLAWARTGGARTAYLQVVADNLPAIGLYRRFGFEDLYRYWYRVAPSTAGRG